VTWRSVAVYWVLAALVGANFYATWLEHRPVAALPEERPPVMVDVPANQIDSATIRFGSQVLVFRRQDGRWTLVEPAGLDVSADLIEALVDTVTSTPPVEVLADVPESLEQYGLDRPPAVVELASGGTRVATLQFGVRNPTRTAAYARSVDGGTVYLVGLNALYYIELIGEDVDRQIRRSGHG